MTIGALIFGVAAAVRAALLARGLRGVRSDDHPICRGCGFDLFGRPADATRCSECGADLTGPRATRFGHRTPRPRLIGRGASILLACAFVGGLYSWGVLRDVGGNTYKPLRWLVSETSVKQNPAGRRASDVQQVRDRRRRRTSCSRACASPAAL